MFAVDCVHAMTSPLCVFSVALFGVNSGGGEYGVGVGVDGQDGGEFKKKRPALSLRLRLLLWRFNMHVSWRGGGRRAQGGRWGGGGGLASGWYVLFGFARFVGP